MSDERQFLYDYVNGKSCMELGVNRTKMNRIMKRFIKDVIDKEDNKK